MTTKKCSKCQEVLDISNFYRSKYKKDGYGYECKDCVRIRTGAKKRQPSVFATKQEYFRHRYANMPREAQEVSYRENHLWYKYRLRIWDYNLLLEMQNYRCAICGIHVSDAQMPDTPNRKSRSKETFHVDHDHACCPGSKSCGKCIRSLLCPPCNLGLGHLKDDVGRLKAAIEYLERGPLPEDWRNQAQDSIAAPSAD